MYAYQIYTKKGLPDHVIRRAEEVERTRKDFTVRKMNLRKLEDEAKIVFNVYRQAWDDNWGAVPPTEAEIMALAKELKMIIDEDIAYIGELDSKPIGFSLSIPDANQALRVANGRLFPFGLIKLLLKKRSINGIRVLAMGILKEHRHQGFDTVFYKRTYDEGMKKGYVTAEASLINETNTPMRHVLEKIGAKIYKTYRMYDLNF
jgi:GNAT superfamily N-acetyltransferase